MDSFESVKQNLEPIDKGINFDAEFTMDYVSKHIQELSDVIISMSHEAERKPEMEKDATSKANLVYEEILSKGDEYQEMIRKIRSVFDDSGVTIEKADNIEGEAISYDYLISKCLRFDYDSKQTICQTIFDGIFNILGLEEDKRPVLTLVASINGRVSRNTDSTNKNDDKNKLGIFRQPDKRRHYTNPLVERNGDIHIYLPNFDDEPDIRDILEILEHECFHAYQFNCRRRAMPIRNVRDHIMISAYTNGYDQYVSSKNDYEGYYNQGYESSARSFSLQLKRATGTLIEEAIKQSMKGDGSE